MTLTISAYFISNFQILLFQNSSNNLGENLVENEWDFLDHQNNKILRQYLGKCKKTTSDEYKHFSWNIGAKLNNLPKSFPLIILLPRDTSVYCNISEMRELGFSLECALGTCRYEGDFSKPMKSLIFCSSCVILTLYLHNVNLCIKFTQFLYHMKMVFGELSTTLFL